MLLSLEPVIATVVGTVALAQALNLQELIGIVLVTVAAVASSNRAQPS
jgi:threonine/homoserine efflux transporter RhtA